MEKNWDNLKAHFQKEIKPTHLRNFLSDDARNKELVFEFDNFVFDITHEKLTGKTLDYFQQVCEKSNIFSRISDMFQGVYK